MRAPNPSFGQSGLKTLLTRSLIVKLSLKHYTRTNQRRVLRNKGHLKGKEGSLLYLIILESMCPVVSKSTFNIPVSVVILQMLQISFLPD
jgi:hypothetical protein